MKAKYLILLVSTSLILGVDQYTKQLVIQKFRLGESLHLIDGFFSLTYVRNPGAAFGLFAQTEANFRIPFFIIVPLVALGMIFYIFRKLADDDYKMATALSLVIGGAFGNLIDRAAYNYVIDFLDFYYKSIHFPAFNVADSAICVGVFFLILDISKTNSSLNKAQKEDSPTNASSTG